MAGRKKRSHAVADEIDESLHHDLDTLCIMIAANEAEEEKMKDDVFDLYTHALKGKLQHKRDDFSKKVIKGYETLLRELRH
jgi:hypothetical protein